ncbi:MAG: hypothetical protein ACI30O_04520 [Muribaculaceae bacterium]
MLRTYLILFMSLFSTLLANAFDYSASDNQSVSPKKLAVEGRTWWYTGARRSGVDAKQEWGIRIGEEVTINDEVWNAVDICMYTDEHKTDEVPAIHNEPMTIGYIKDDGRTVCAMSKYEGPVINALRDFYCISSSEPYYLYTFGDVSEKCILGYSDQSGFPYVIKEIREITNSGIKYRYFEADGYDNGYNDFFPSRDGKFVFIEGIGHPDLFLLSPHMGGTTSFAGFTDPHLTYVTEGDDNHVIFEAAGGAKLWEMSGVESVVADPETGVEQWFNLQGVSISQPSAPGLYIRRIGSKTEKILVR